MKLLVITQIVDPEDYVFGYFYGHILDLAETAAEVHVLCLEHRGGELPDNVTVHSLGKEKAVTRFQYLKHFYRFTLGRLRSYDTVFVHMEPLYVLLGGIFWRLSGKRVILWYNHVHNDYKLRVAVWLVHKMIGVSKHTMPVRHRKTEWLTHDRDLVDLIAK